MATVLNIAALGPGPIHNTAWFKSHPGGGQVAGRALGAGWGLGDSATTPLSRKTAAQLWARLASERGDTSGTPDEVGQPLDQAALPGLLDLEGAGEEVVEGAVAHGHHGAGEADDVVGHAEVRRGQAHQQWLCVEPHKVAGAVRGWEAGGRERPVRQDGHCPTSHPTHPHPRSLATWDSVSGKHFQSFLSLLAF